MAENVLENAQSDNSLEIPAEVNKHVVEYLKYFFDFEGAPRYAVLIKGRWGVGKTFLIKKVLKEIHGFSKSYCYVSLLGVSGIEEVDQAVLRVLYPRAFGTPGKLLGYAAKAALKAAKIDTDIKPIDFVNRFTADIFIFDDLERCEMSVNQVLGYINGFIEHDDVKVVIVANEEEIDEVEGVNYRRRREKLVGKVLEVQSAFKQALDNFLKAIRDPDARKIIHDRAKEISTLYGESELTNLRVLQQTIWDFERICQIIDDRHKKNESGLTIILNLFFALSFDFKAGRITAGDLIARKIRRLLRQQQETTETNFEKAQRLYKSTDLSDTVLTDNVLLDLLDRGLFDKASVNGSIAKSRHFVEPSEIPAWRIVWERDFYPDVDGEQAIEELERQFTACEFTETGEVLHVFGIRLSLAMMS